MGFFDSGKKFIGAAKAGDYETVQHYLTKFYGSGKVDLDARDAEGITALSHAARKGQAKVLKRMIIYNLDKNIADNEGHTPLLAAILEKQRESALILIEHFADVTAHGADGIQPLHGAAHIGDLDLVKALEAKGADLNAVIIANGYTPLHWAIINGHAPVVEFFVQAGARTDIPDKTGKTAFDIAKEKGAHMVKIVETPPAPKTKPEEFPLPAETEADGDAADKWLRTGRRVTHIAEYPEISRRLTEIFNFETRERTILAENLKTGAEALTPPESFDNIAGDALKKALAEFKRLGGEADEAQVIGRRNPGPRPFQV